MAKSRIHLSALVVGVGTAASRALGLAREILTAHVFGTSALQSSFVLAWQFPNLFRKLFGEGALSAAFVPQFTKTLHEGDAARAARKANRLANQILTLLLVIVGGIAAIAIALSFPCVGLLVRAGGPDAPALARILAPYAPVICMAAITGGALNVLGDYKSWAFAPCLLNIVWILALVAVRPFSATDPVRAMHFIAWALLGAGALQFAFLWLVFRRKGFTVRPDFSGLGNPAVRAVLRNWAPTAIGSAVFQLNLLFDTVLARCAADWAPSALSYAERIVYLPLGLVATAYSTALLPTLSGLFVEREFDRLRTTLSSSFQGILVLMVPAAVGLAVLAGPVTSLFYESGRFGAADTVRVARALGCYALGLPFIGLQKATTQFYYAENKIRTPVRVAYACVALNIALNIAFILSFPAEWKHVGIAAATTLSSVAGLAALLARMRQALGVAPDTRTLLRRASTTLLATVPMAAAAHATVRYLPRLGLFPAGKLGCVAVIAVAMAAAIVVYAGALAAVDRDSHAVFGAFLRRLAARIRRK